MLRPALVTIVTTLFMAPITAAAQAQPSARTLYEAALARERALRVELDLLAPGTLSPTLEQELRRVIEAYESVVRRYPVSGYSDNALWQAGRLAADAAALWHQDRDRKTAVRLLGALVREYPTSSLVPRAKADLARLEEPQPGVAPSRLSAPTKPAPASQTVTLATVRAIARSLTPEGARVTVELDREVAFKTESLDGPPRAVFDFAPTQLAPALREGSRTFATGPVSRIRIGRHPGDVTRVVLELDGVKQYSTYVLYNPYRVVVDCEAGLPAATPALPTPVVPPVLAGRALPLQVTTAPSWEPQPLRLTERLPAVGLEPVRVEQRPPLAAAPLIVVFMRLPDAVPSGTFSTAAAGPGATQPPADTKPPVPAAAGKPVPTSTLPSPDRPVPPAANTTGGFSLARQLGLGASRIVLDPGHGGIDPGAIANGLTEASVVLDIALRIEALLLQQPGTEVILTRRSDQFMPLEERTALANRSQADIFVSIHANASRAGSANGVETYFLNFATTPEAEMVAARENAATGQTMTNLADIIRAIALNSKLDESRDLATFLQQALVRRLRGANRSVKDLGVKQAPFVVLVGADMPSVLVEVSFITNQNEARLLKNPAYRQRIAEAIADGIRRYQQALKGQWAGPTRGQPGVQPDARKQPVEPGAT